MAVPLEPELASRMAESRAGVELLYEPELLPPPRFPSDHGSASDFVRSRAAEERWQALLARAEILFGIPGDTPEGLADVVRGSQRLRWFRPPRLGPANRCAQRG